MKKLFFISLCCCISLNTIAIDTLTVIPKPLIKRRIKIHASTNFDLASNCFNVLAYKKINRGGFINDDLKAFLLKRSANYNRIGFDADQLVTVQFRPRRVLKNYFKWLELGFANRNHAHAGFSYDALNLLLNGNSFYVGKTANLNDLLFNVLQYQQVRIGFASDSNDSLKSKFVFGVSLLNGQRNVYFYAPVFRFLTAPDGYSISGTLNYQISNVPLSLSHFGTNNGLGFSLEVDYKEEYKIGFLNTTHNQFHFMMKDLGFIQWRNNSYNFELDTNFYYQGVVINSFKDSILWPFTSDSLKSSYVNFKRNSFSSTLPAFLLLENTFELAAKHRLTIGIQHRILAAYKPQLRTEYEYRWNKKLSTLLLITKGGYNNASVNLSGKFVLINKLQAQIGVNHIQSFINQKNSGGIGLWAGLSFWL